MNSRILVVDDTPANIQALARATLLKVTGSRGQVLLTTNGG